MFSDVFGKIRSSWDFAMAVKSVFLIVYAILLGNVSYEVFLYVFSNHWNAINAQNLGIINSSSAMYGLKRKYLWLQRILPSYEISFIARLIGRSYSSAGYIFYRILFCLISVASLLLVYVTQGCQRRTAPVVALFVITNTGIICSGYWLQAFDLQTELFTLVLFTVFLSEWPRAVVLIVGGILFSLWQFSFEEALYVPLIYLIEEFLRLSKSSGGFKPFVGASSVLLSKRGLAWVFAIIASLWITAATRAYMSRFFLYTQLKRPDHPLLSEGSFLVSNLGKIVEQLRIIFHPLWTLSSGYWWIQGDGIYIVLFLAFISLIATNCMRLSAKYASIVVFTGLEFIITLFFTNLSQEDAFLPLIASLLALVVYEKKVRLIEPYDRKAA